MGIIGQSLQEIESVELPQMEDQTGSLTSVMILQELTMMARTFGDAR